MKLLLDQGVSRSVPALLDQHGHPCVHVADYGMSAAQDIDIMARAKQEDRVLVTYDNDFPQLLAISGDVEPSVILVRVQNLKRQEFADLVADVLIRVNNEVVAGAVVSVNQRRIRTRLLPLRPPGSVQAGQP